MPEYNTRLRTNAQILPPRRLRQNESPPRAKPPSQPSSLSQFPPPNVQFHPHDASSRIFLAIGRALFAVENRAVTIKDLSYLTMEHGLVCQNVSAASQAITTFIRNHLNRCRQDHSMPLLLSLPLTGTDADDRLTPALYSRSGGTSLSTKSSDSVLTNFRRGTTVWYLSEAAGAVCPFRKAGLNLDDITSPPSLNGTKRKRDPQSTSTQPRKHHVNSPSCSYPIASPVHPQSHPKSSRILPRIKFTLKMHNPPASTFHSCSPSDSELELSASEADGDISEDNDGSESELESSTLTTRTIPSENDSDGSDDSFGDSVESKSVVHDPHDLPHSDLYPDYPTIPTVQCSDSYPFYFAPCSIPSITSTLTSFRTAFSNPSRNSRVESISPSQSAGSPPPDSEDEDDDFHNSMVGLRRDSVPVVEHCVEYTSKVPKFEPISPKFIPGSVHLSRKSPEIEIPSDPEPGSPSLGATSTPLETLPGFVLEPESTSSSSPVKEEKSIIATSYLVDPCHNQLDDSPKQDFSIRARSINDFVRIDDIEILGPETVLSREWDMAWSQFDGQTFDGMDVDPSLMQEKFQEQRTNHPTEARLPLCLPLSSLSTLIPSDIHLSTILTRTFSRTPTIFTTVVNDVPLYCTMFGSDTLLVRRHIDDDSINITQLHRSSLQVPYGCLFMSNTLAHPRMLEMRELLQGVSVSPDAAKVDQSYDQTPADMLNIFLSSDRGKRFIHLSRMSARDVTDESIADILMKTSDQYVSIGDESRGSPSEVGIRVEDLYVDIVDSTKKLEKEIKQKHGMSASESARSNPPAPVDSVGSQNISSLNEEEENLFLLFLNLGNEATAWNQRLLLPIQNRPSSNSSNTSSSLESPALSFSKSLSDTSDFVVMNGKQDSTVPVYNIRKRRNKAAPVQPVRRSTRVASRSLPPSLTRARRKTKQNQLQIGI